MHIIHKTWTKHHFFPEIYIKLNCILDKTEKTLYNKSCELAKANYRKFRQSAYTNCVKGVIV